MIDERATTSGQHHDLGAGRLFVNDVRLGFMLVNEVRYQAFELVGVRREDANLATFVVAGMVADTVHRRVSKMMRLAKRPSPGDMVLAGGAAGELLHDLGGPSSRDVPYYTALIVFAFGTSRSGPIVRRSFAGVTRLSRRTFESFHRHYGYLLGRHERP